VEEYGRAGLFGKRLPAARALYASHWAALSAALDEHMPDGCAWNEPTGGMFTWMRLPEHLDTVALRAASTEAGVAYVPGRPFYVEDAGFNELRLSFSHLDEGQLATAAERLGKVVESALVAV
jgi:2-aminoadipate transaminase